MWPDEERRKQVRIGTADIRAVRHELGEGGLAQLKTLEAQSTVRAVVAFAADWTLLIGAWLLTAYDARFFVLSCIVFGIVQRALGNLLHEAGHRNLFNTRWLNDVWANLLVGLPSFSAVAPFRKVHNAHHSYVGDPEQDPDYIHRDRSPEENTPFRIWADNTLKLSAVFGSLRGQWLHSTNLERLLYLVWWAVVVSAMYAFVGADAFLFVALWFTARATVFHGITMFREISDHVGLVPGGVFSFTRNSPGSGAFRWIIHPHNNGYHLVHHLDARVPWFNLPKAHQLMQTTPIYQQRGINCTTYFVGGSSLIASWSSARTTDAIAAA